VPKYFQALLREATESSLPVTLAEQAEQGSDECLNVFGKIVFPYPPDVYNCTMGALAKIEWNVIETLLRKILKE
jgi:hypothetical protein